MNIMGFSYGAPNRDWAHQVTPKILWSMWVKAEVLVLPLPPFITVALSMCIGGLRAHL